MQIIKCWDICVWDGGDRCNHKYYVKTKEAADMWVANNSYDSVYETEIVLFDGYDEIMSWRNGEVRQRALDKLTNEEKLALGVS